MTTALDTNVVITLWNDEAVNEEAEIALDRALSAGPLVMSAPVYSELLGYPARNEEMLDTFCRESGIIVDWQIDQRIWRAAGSAFQSYVQRRRRSHSEFPRRILADFLIGAHASVNGFTLLTLDQHIFKSAFPDLKIETI